MRALSADGTFSEVRGRDRPGSPCSASAKSDGRSANSGFTNNTAGTTTNCREALASLRQLALSLPPGTLSADPVVTAANVRRAASLAKYGNPSSTGALPTITTLGGAAPGVAGGASASQWRPAGSSRSPDGIGAVAGGGMPAPSAGATHVRSASTGSDSSHVALCGRRLPPMLDPICSNAAAMHQPGPLQPLTPLPLSPIGDGADMSMLRQIEREVSYCPKSSPTQNNRLAQLRAAAAAQLRHTASESQLVVRHSLEADEAARPARSTPRCQSPPTVAAAAAMAMAARQQAGSLGAAQAQAAARASRPSDAGSGRPSDMEDMAI